MNDNGGPKLRFGNFELDPRTEEERIKELMARAHRLQDAGDRDGARAALEQVLQIDSGHPEALEMLQHL